MRDGTGAYLDGGKTYKLTVPGPVPGKLFWSMTVYDVDTRCLIATDQDKAAIRSLVDKPQANADGSYDLYFGPKAPVAGGGQAGGHGRSRPSRARGGGPGSASTAREAPAFDGTWKLNDIAEVK